MMTLKTTVTGDKYAVFPGMTSRWMQFFLVANIVIGVIASLKIRDFSLPDESAHYFRALEVSQGRWINTVNHVGVSIPCAEYKEVGTANGPIWGLIDVDAVAAANPDKPCFANTRNTAGTYSPVLYMFSGAGIAIASAAGLDAPGKHDAGRILNAIGNTVIIFLALCLVQQQRVLLAFLSTIPLAFWLRSSLSADAVATSACFLFLCVLLRFSEVQISLKYRHVLWITAAAVFVGATKPLYCVLPFSAIMLWKPQANVAAGLKGVAMLLLPGFASVLTAYLLTLAADPSLIFISGGCSPHEQLQGILRNPLRFVGVLATTVEKYSTNWVYETVSPMYMVEYISLTVLLCLTSASVLGVAQRIVLLLTAIGISVATATALYMTYSSVGAPEIAGLQGRLFIPPVIFGLVAVSLGKIHFPFLPLIRNMVGYVFSLAFIAHYLRYYA